MHEEMAGIDETANDLPSATGGCLCGAVRYRLFGSLRDVVNCHCGQCLRTHGNFAAYTSVKRAAFDLIERRGLRWYDSSDRARRGYCCHCGASLFWERTGGHSISVSAGTIDPPSGLKTTQDIFVADKGDYYELAPGTRVTMHGGLPPESVTPEALAPRSGGINEFPARDAAETPPGETE